MASRRFRVPRCSSSYPSRGPRSRDTAHRRARGAPGIGVGRLYGPGHPSDGPRRARAHRAGDGDRRRGRRRRPHRFHARAVHRLLVRRRDRGQAITQSPRSAGPHGHLGRTSRSHRAGARGASARGTDRAARRHARGGWSPGRGRGAARGAGGTAAGRAHTRRDPHADVKRRLGFSTRAVHGDPETRPDWAPVVAPLYQSATFTNPIGSAQEVIYARYGNNPNHVAIAKRLALLEGAEAALFAQEFGRFGIDVSFVNPLEPRTWKRGLKKNTRAIFVETPTNPLLRVLDLEPIATLCKTEGLALLVDATFATPLNYRPLEHGADVVIHSATKYLNGHADVLAGAVAGSESVIEEVRKLLHVWGQALDPMAAWLIDRGMKTLAVRVARQNQTALALAQWCAEQPQFIAVHYPGLPSHADHDVAKRILNGFGGMLGVELKGGARAAERFLRALTIATHAPSLGGVETLVSEPRLTSHAGLTPDARARAGIADGFLRFSIGLEDSDDIIADFAQALAQL